MRTIAFKPSFVLFEPLSPGIPLRASITTLLLFQMLFSFQLSAQSIDLSAGASAVQLGDLDVSGNQLTVEALVYMKQNTAFGNIVSKHLNPGNVNYLLRPATFEITAYLKGNAGATHFIQVINPVKLALNTWYHLAATYDGRRVQYYVNGCMVADSAFDGNLCQNNFITAIGNRSSCSCEQFMGKVDEVRIWKTARTAQEISDNMLRLSNPVGQPGLLAAYPFNGTYTNAEGNHLWDGRPNGKPVFTTGDAAVSPFAITSLVAANADCRNAKNGGITVNTNRSNVLYSIDGVNYQLSNSFTGLKPGNYTVNARDESGCTLSSSVTVADNRNYVAVSTSVSLCHGTVDGHSTAGTYLDTILAASGCDTLRTLIITASQEQRVTITKEICEGQSYAGYHVSGMYTDTFPAANGCDSIRMLSLTVTPEPRPNLGGSRAICKGDSIQLSPGLYNSYLWQDGSSADHITVTRPGTYSVQVANSCGISKEQVLIADGYCGMFFPNAFTPNGDGANDLFRPAVYNLSNFQWRIFNRMGQVVFQGGDGHGWDGRVNGQLQNAGAYVWVCSYTFQHQQVSKKGVFLLIR